jgi:hypothetical protein
VLGCPGTEQVSLSWRRMPPGTGGRASYGHCHPGQEEVYFVISGTVTFKVGDDVFTAGPQTAVRMSGDTFYTAHNDTDRDAELLIFSTRLEDPPLDKQDGFWRSGNEPTTGGPAAREMTTGSHGLRSPPNGATAARHGERASALHR